MIKRLIFISLIFLGCSKEKAPENLPEKELFNEVDSEISGINFSNDLQDNRDLNIIEYLYYYNGGGVSIGDINNDGLEDIYLTANQKPDKLYLNLGNLKFKDISISSKIAQDNSWSTGVTMVDINNDGNLDIYVCKVGNYKTLKAKNQLYINNGDNTFKEEANKYGLDFSGFSTQASFFDYDQDGDMDMYLLNHSVHSTYSYGNAKLREKSDALAGDILYENVTKNGKIKFIDVTKKSGIYNSPLGYGLAIATSDVNNDGLLDIYVGNDFHENDYLYINNGNKTFTESSKDYFTSTSRFTMGVDVADINNDKKLDLITLDMMPYKANIFLKSGGEDSDKINEIKKSFGFEQQYARNHMQINNGNHFSDIALFNETHATDWSWSPLLLDFNNDGLQDVYITNGIYKRPNDLDYVNYLSNVSFAKYEASKQDTLENQLIKTMPMLALSNVLFENSDNLRFTKKAINSNNKTSYSNGAAYADLDLDGDLDIVVNNLNDKATLLENKSDSTNYITINLLENKNSLNTNGAKVHVYSGTKSYYKEQTTVRGFLSSSTRKLHFGLGNSLGIDSIKVIWNDGTETTQKNILINQELTINKIQPTKHTFDKIQNPAYNKFSYSHEENSFLDYEREGLMPEKLSTEGPSFISADFNADGLNDLFIGGARNQKPVLYFQTIDGKYNSKNEDLFEKDKIYEDVDAIAFDIDGDNDLDIYALSGGNDFKEGDPMLEDRVYINDGRGNFTKLDARLLATNGGSVSAMDFNKDGFQDLFIGNRSIPGAYGLSPFSFILKNTGNNNFEIAEKKRFGMITDSKWADLNNDNQMELIIAGDWMPITVLSYTKEGKFENKTKDYGLDKSHGMWNVIKIVDLNGDGFLDVLGGNTGTNFKWKATKENPVKIYLDDFDGNKQLDQLIFYNYFGTDVPFASKDKLVAQIPKLKKQFLKYATFSEVKSLNDLKLKDENSILETKYLYELRSMVFFNKGNGFMSKPLPKEAQLSTIEDFNIHNNQILYTGNYDGFVTELGKSLSNSGGVLQIDNDNIKNLKKLELPQGFLGRKVIQLNDNEYLILSNNGESYIINNIK